MNLIIGAGFTGMAAGIKTGWEIYERSNHPGGICRSYKKDGFEFSTGGGHWLFGKGKGLNFIKDLVGIKEYERRAGVYYNTTFDYPFQTTAEQQFEPSNGSLKEWCKDNFGIEQCNLFFNPFNEKYTAGLYDSIIQEYEYKSPKAGGKGFCPTFADPIGGINNLVKKMSDSCLINYGKELHSIDTMNRIATFKCGEVVEYEHIISTIPLDRLVRLCGQECSLPYTSVLVINIGADKTPYTPHHHWMYVPFCKSGFYRVGFYSNVEENKAPNGCVGLSVEMAFFGKKYSDLDIEQITFDVIKELQEWRWIDKVITIDPTWVECAYTWMYEKRDIQTMLSNLKQSNITSTGRYGKWKFQGMIQSIEDGFNVEV